MCKNRKKILFILYSFNLVLELMNQMPRCGHLYLPMLSIIFSVVSEYNVIEFSSNYKPSVITDDKRPEVVSYGSNNR